MNVLGFGRGKWVSGMVENILILVTFQVKLKDGNLVKCHANQMRHKYDTSYPVGETSSPGEGQGNDQIDPKDLLPPVLIPPPLNSDRVRDHLRTLSIFTLVTMLHQLMNCPSLEEC